MIFRIFKHVIYDLLRTRFVLVYLLLLMAGTFSFFNMESDAGKVMVSVLNIVLLVVPLVSVVYATIHFHNSYEFMTLMITQPVSRGSVFFAEFGAVGASLSFSFLAGVGLPMLLYQSFLTGLPLLVSGLLLTLVFVSIAFLVSVMTTDKSRAIGLALLSWFWFSVLYDGLLMFILFWFSDYPVERMTIGLISLNPIDLARIMVLLKLDYSALMGYTSAMYREFFGNTTGMFFSAGVLIIWLMAPLFWTIRIFRKKDL